MNDQQSLFELMEKLEKEYQAKRKASEPYFNDLNEPLPWESKE